MIYVYLITVTMRFEYNNHFEKEWTETSNLYCYKTEQEARKQIWQMKQNETKKYSEWLKKDEKTRGLFIHHYWDVEKLDIY